MKLQYRDFFAMKQTFQDKSVLIVGATGGLGNAAAQAFSLAGAQLLLAGRDAQKLQKLRQQFSVPVFQVDIADAESVEALKNSVPHVDVVVNLTGTDVRKPLDSHSIEEIQRLIAVNLTGSIYLTRVFLPLMKAQQHGIIFHVGGFGDGRLAFPFYSVDAATRAGLSSFIESLNRELRLEKSPVRLIYFSPSPADTETERPFHGVWREMGLQIEAPSVVADELLRAVSNQRERYLMGGMVTDIFARLNAAFPRLADFLMMNHYGNILQKHFGG
jgi:NADP-dependent 3-hydroxy acid dehydrogenase YdfG